MRTRMYAGVRESFLASLFRVSLFCVRLRVPVHHGNYRRTKNTGSRQLPPGCACRHRSRNSSTGDCSRSPLKSARFCCRFAAETRSTRSGRAGSWAAPREIRCDGRSLRIGRLCAPMDARARTRAGIHRRCESGLGGGVPGACGGHEGRRFRCSGDCVKRDRPLVYN